MKESLYIYNSGTLVRKDNTLRFINQNDEKKDIPIERYSDIYIFGEVTSLWKKVCKKSANCDKIEIITQEADFLWQEGKGNRWVRERKIS